MTPVLFLFLLPSGTLYRDADDVTTGAAARGTPFPFGVAPGSHWSGGLLSPFLVKGERGTAVGVSCRSYIKYTHLLLLISLHLVLYLFFPPVCPWLLFPIGRGAHCVLLSKHLLSLQIFHSGSLYKPLLYSDEMPAIYIPPYSRLDPTCLPLFII